VPDQKIRSVKIFRPTKGRSFLQAGAVHNPRIRTDQNEQKKLEINTLVNQREREKNGLCLLKGKHAYKI
jgi:hypothetical protein